ncbi:hypothetical protein F3K43_12570 [Streptomyces sp. LBUM 1476]|nr:hypothetical protein [Streptomyces sp. LBUM 1476]MBZ3915264.1 Lsr2 family protein [Streptomyces acidiscabies]
MRLGLHRDLKKIRQDFSLATPRSTGARAAASARLRDEDVAAIRAWTNMNEHEVNDPGWVPVTIR